MAEPFWAFLAISLVVIVTPGQDTALTIRNSLAGGRNSGIATALGVAAGQAVWALATAIGVVAFLVTSEPVFAAVKLAGAGYIVSSAPIRFTPRFVRTRWAAQRRAMQNRLGSRLRLPCVREW